MGWRGAGIYSSGTLTITGSLIDSNTAGYTGGGLYANGGKITILNSTFARNVAWSSDGAYGWGGGVVNWYGTMVMRFTTLAANKARWGAREHLNRHRQQPDHGCQLAEQRDIPWSL